MAYFNERRAIGYNISELRKIRDAITGVLNNKLTPDLVSMDNQKYQEARNKIVNGVNKLSQKITNLETYNSKCLAYAERAKWHW